LITGTSVYENLDNSAEDKFQFILPYYEYSKSFFNEMNFGYFNFTSLGENNLKNTNNLRTRIINDINFNSFDTFTDSGFINKFNIYFKNLNTVAKNDETYKSSPQMQLMNIIEINSSLPLKKKDQIFESEFEPKISFRINPGKMKNYTNDEKNIYYENLFDINRLQISDSFEPGKSVTVGFNYIKKEIDNINDYFEFNFGTVIRDKAEIEIPRSSRINNKYSNFFGTMSKNWDNLLYLNYDFSINNNLNNLEYNSLNLEFKKNNFFSQINYLEENGDFGSDHVYETKIGFSIDENNLLKFNTRRNKKINLTEFYDLIYEYKNDCLTAGIKYNKSFYEDRDLKPSENLMFTITLFPLTTLEQGINR